MPDSRGRNRRGAALWPRSQSFGTTRSAQSSTTLTTKQSFDPESGQVYTEAELRPNRASTTNWIRDFSSPHVVTTPQPSPRGARSLADIARTKVARELGNLTPDHFETVPWSVAEKVWDIIVETRSESLHAFRTFATAYPDAEEFGKPRYRHMLRIRQPSQSFLDYYKGITSLGMKWLTCLRVAPKQLSTQDLVSIHTITNLVVLDLTDTNYQAELVESNFDERLMMSWAQLASAGEAFQHLRVLMFGWQENLSEWIFNYSHRFPSLCHMIVTECPNMHQNNRADWETTSKAAGWEARHAKRSVKSLRPIIGNTDFYPGSVSGCYYESEELFAELAHSRRPDLVQRLPLLEAWIGALRPWSHIVEEFPKSTQTIFFENMKTKTRQELDGAKASRKREQTKRVRNQEQPVPGTASPPPKRGQQPRPTTRSAEKTLADVLQEFNAR